ncbi:hypothetical protein CsSME_00025324 [Camellia sinensis var. sinensis]
MVQELIIGSNEAMFNGGFFDSSEQFHNSVLDPITNNNVVSGFPSADFKRIKLSSESNQQELDFHTCGEASPLGLTLKKTPSFLNLVEMTLSHSRSKNCSTGTHHTSSIQERCRAKKDDFVYQPMYEKLKASNFPALLLKIGSWERKSLHEGNLVAKCYYAKKKIVWEVLEGALKSKIEIQWSDIEAIRAIIRDDEPGILEIELNQQPQFFRETNPQPRKHTLWQQAMDFTGGQAAIYRRHYIKFPPRTLDKHYEKLLQCDKRLLELSQKPFPRMETPYFYSNIYEVTDIPFDFTVRRSQVPPTLQHSFSTIPRSLVPPHPIQNFKLTTRQPFGIMDSNSPMSVMDFPRSDDNVNGYTFDNRRMVHWGQQGNNVENVLAREDQIQANANAAFSSQGYPNTGLLGDLENHLLGDSQNVCSNERTLLARVSSMCSLLDPFEVANPQNNNSMNQSEYKQGKFSDDHLILGTTEHSGVDGGLCYPQPICCLAPRVSDESHMMHLPRDNSSYPYDFYHPEVNDYGFVDTGHGVHQ